MFAQRLDLGLFYFSFCEFKQKQMLHFTCLILTPSFPFTKHSFRTESTPVTWDNSVPQKVFAVNKEQYVK